jgi:DNA-binding NarL/FixJ family response regulator
MPDLSGLNCLSLINKEYSGVRALILSSLMDEASVMNCLEHGINGFLTKDIELTEIIRAIAAKAGSIRCCPIPNPVEPSEIFSEYRGSHR